MCMHEIYMNFFPLFPNKIVNIITKVIDFLADLFRTLNVAIDCLEDDDLIKVKRNSIKFYNDY